MRSSAVRTATRVAFLPKNIHVGNGCKEHQSRTLQKRWMTGNDSKKPTDKSLPPHQQGQQPLTIKPNMSIMEEKAKRAEQLHAELNDLLSANAKRRAEEQAAGFGSGFAKFLKTNKSQLLNIGVSFVCVIFAHQIVGMRQAGRKLEEKLQKSETQLEQTQQTLQSLTDEEFVQSVAKECVEALTSKSETDGSSTSSIWGLSRSTKIVNITANNKDSIMEKLKPAIRTILQNRIGDSGLSEEQRKVKIVDELKSEMERKSMEEQMLLSSSPEKLLTQLAATNETTESSLPSSSSSSSEVVEVTETEGGGKVVRRQRFSI
mmetsp:Transcript_17194/g.24201  ORF Transcript_17194/g.24201 Transcript_17194/m.24201 type:complete len:318 (-) Transcript_17194:62-1015(-)